MPQKNDLILHNMIQYIIIFLLVNLCDEMQMIKKNSIIHQIKQKKNLYNKIHNFLLEAVMKFQKITNNFFFLISFILLLT